MIFSKPELVLLAERAAIDASIAPELLCSLVDVSSAWLPNKAEFIATHGIPFNQWDETNVDERTFRNYRWGLTQVLGSAARDAGYKGDLHALIEPPLNLSVGAAVLARLLALASMREERALALWIGIVGSNFPLRVLAKVPQYVAFLHAAERPAQLEKMEGLK
jgi:soluble lytic murein transglycosylase-like protein